MIDEAELKRTAAKLNISTEVVEKDYALNWMLSAISENKPLHDYLVFKGGTCLSKVYFSNTWRLSEDLDFSVNPAHLLDFDAFKANLSAALEAANAAGAPMLQIDGDPWENDGMIRARIKYRRVAQVVSPQTRAAAIKLEINKVEKVIYASQSGKISPIFSEPALFEVQCYALPELFAEKLRALMQRSYARDYYDVWRMTKLPPAQTGYSDHEDHLQEVLSKKCNLNQVPYEPEIIFSHQRIGDAREKWNEELERLVSPGQLPEFNSVLHELKEYFPKIDALAEFKQDPTAEHTRTIIYLGKNNLYLVMRAAQVLGDHLRSKRPKTVLLALDAGLELAGVDKRIGRGFLEWYSDLLKAISENPESLTRQKAKHLLENLENQRRGP
ncbi:nucleotidyl transferase AbiEii/AbiGii toxin family protein [Candidatus Micrarchaeota archaeon]|nr:nucleotidyl transferase AbiEii/AbiGii toxin family protein [Candidatus Micrarchaeota archaeon]